MISFCRKILISNLKCKYLHDVNCQDWPFVGENPTKSDYLVMFHHKIYVIRHIPDKLIGANKVREAQGRGLLTTGCTVYICFSLVWLWHQVYRSKSATSCHILCILGGLDLDVLRVDTLSPVSSAWKQNRAMKSTKRNHWFHAPKCQKCVSKSQSLSFFQVTMFSAFQRAMLGEK